MQNQLQQVRRFNRLVSQRAGVLDQDYLGAGRPLSEARVLFEIGPEGSGVKRLRDRLGLDSGYLSRLLRTLEAQNLIEVAPSPQDRRAREARLTAQGLAEHALYDRLSDEKARSILTALDPRQQERLVTAMAEVERLLRASEVSFSVEAPDSADARHCVTAYFSELAERFDTGYDPHNAPADDGEFTAPKGVFVVAWLDGAPVGCGGVKALDGQTAEIKRLWTSSDVRGLGVGKRLLRQLEQAAREMGMKRMCLDTNRALSEARAFYLSEGYEEIARYNDNPYAHHWFARAL